MDNDIEQKTMQTSGNTIYIFLVCIVAAVGGFLFGFDTAVIAGTIPFLTKYFSLNDAMLGWAVSSVLVGCIFGAVFAGGISDRFGRKRVLIGCAVLFAISAIGSAIPRHLSEFILARFIGGLGVGAASMLSPMYIAEISPAKIRGRLVSLNQLTIVIGILIAYFTNFLLKDVGPTNWRWMFGSEALPALLFLFFLLAVPESPRWLVKQNRDKEAMAILSKVNGHNRAKAEMAEIKDAIAHEENSVAMLFHPGMRVALVIGVVLAILQQVTGINIIMYYAPTIFASAGSGLESSLLQTIVVGIVNLTFTIVAICVVDRLGRKALLLIGSGGMAIFLAIIGAVFHFGRFDGPWVLLGIVGYIACFAVGMGPVVWVIMSEIFPTRIRGRAMSISTVFLWISCFLVSLTFPIMLKRLDGGLTFGIYAAMCVIAFVFVLTVVPETKGKTLEEIERYWLK